MGIEIKSIIPEYNTDCNTNSDKDYIDTSQYNCFFYAPIVNNGTCRFCMKIHN